MVGMDPMRPLLSICVPTFNRAGYLRVMLEALLPQAAEAGGGVEVWVLDNASDDGTPEVLARMAELGPLRVHRQEANRGPIENIAMGPRELAEGEYCWVLGDHNVMRPGGLARVLDALRGRRDLDVFYINFRCADYPLQWPEHAVGGWDGGYRYLGNSRLPAEGVAHWWELLDAPSAFCTQSYAHVVRTRVCREFWAGRRIAAPFTDGLTCYPQTWLVVSTLFAAPAGCVTDPVLTIFNGAQSWGAVMRQVYLTGLPELLDFCRRNGLPEARYREGREFNRGQVRRVVSGVAANGCGVGKWVLGAGWRGRWLLGAVWDGYMDAQASWVSRGLRRVGRILERWYRYWFHHCRPARWWRRRAGGGTVC